MTDSLTQAITDELTRQGGYYSERSRERRFSSQPEVAPSRNYAGKIVIGDDSDADGVDIAALADAVRAHLQPTITSIEELDALPEYAVIRADEKRDGRRHTIGRYFEKCDMRRNEWLELDPGDRSDGENTVPAELIINYYATAGATVLYRPETA